MLRKYNKKLSNNFEMTRAKFRGEIYKLTICKFIKFQLINLQINL